MKNEQAWQDIPITILDRPWENTSILTTETLRNIMRCDKLKNVWRADGDISEFVRDSLDEVPELITRIQTVEMELADSQMVID